LKTKRFNDPDLAEIIESKYDIEIDSPIIKKVTKLDLGQLDRPCFNGKKILEPVQVNLLHGANGTGKTTFLETIELAITGENSRSKLFKEGNINEVTVSCYTNKGFETFSSKRQPIKSKKMENSWYGVPIGRGKTTLNQNFSLFNYFDTDKPYRFALEEIDDESENHYLNRFSQLIFGDHIIKMQKNWLRYKIGFETRHKKLINKDIEITNQLDEINDRIMRFKQSNTINNDYFINSFNKVLFRNNFNENQPLKEENFKNFVEILEYLEKPLEIIESLGKHYNKLTPLALKHDSEKLNSRILMYEEEIKSTSIEKDKCEFKVNNIKKDIQQI
ncbi:AAA family ATPase, partial [Psychrobacillus sp. FJAT-21963]|uniref:AAA family ATPase n=1 Tax=Psychrobacillus sp. FJAT-21963 TaxID=1712028 RepID=UPI0007080C94